MDDCITIDDDTPEVPKEVKPGSSRSSSGLPDIEVVTLSDDNAEEYEDTVLKDPTKLKKARKIFAPKTNYQNNSTIIYSAFSHVINKVMKPLPQHPHRKRAAQTPSTSYKDLEKLEKENLLEKKMLEEKLRKNNEEYERIQVKKMEAKRRTSSKLNSSPRRRMSMRCLPSTAAGSVVLNEMDSEGNLVKIEKKAEEDKTPQSAEKENETPLSANQVITSSPPCDEIENVSPSLASPEKIVIPTSVSNPEDVASPLTPAKIKDVGYFESPDIEDVSPPPMSGDIEDVNPPFADSKDVSPPTTVSPSRETTPIIIPKIPFDENYDPYEALPSHRYAREMAELDEQIKRLYYQINLPSNDVRVPGFREDPKTCFYLLDLLPNIRSGIEKQIKELGGTIVEHIGKASRVIFTPNNDEPMNKKSLFTFLTAAIGGRFLLPSNYIENSHQANEFLNVDVYNSLSTYEESLDLDADQLAAIKISIKYRMDFEKGKFPVFHRANILFCEPQGEQADVHLLLQMLGAYVQPYYKADIKPSNHTITLIITSNKVKVPYILGQVTPIFSPENVRNLLWKEYDKYKIEIE